MKDLIAKIKTMDYKQFALQHGEKIGMGIIGVIAFTCLALTSWTSGFSGTPDGMERRAEDMANKLKNNPWPDSEKKAFLPLIEAQNELDRILAEVDPAKYRWDVEMSKKLYQPQVPAVEPDWVPVSELYAFTGKMPLAVAVAPSSNEVADEPEVKKPAKGSKKGSKKNNDAEDLLKTMPGPGMGPGAGGFGIVASEKARGVRFNVIVGIVNVQLQYNKLRTALHLDFPHQARNHLEYSDFKIQRQRAVPGPDPWSGPWKDVSKDSSIDILSEASEIDPEPIDFKYANQVFTSPLPKRLDVDWDPRLVVHHKIPTLSEEELVRQDEEMLELKEKLAGEDGGKGRSHGFSGLQGNNAKMRDIGRESGMIEFGGGMGGMGGGGAMGGGRGNRMGQMGQMGPRGGSGGMGPMGPMGGNPNYGRGPQASDGGPELLLFRYFDFDVEPGECYRYRVQLVVENPSYGESFVANPDVAAGEFRETPWSAASTAVAVDKDVNYALAKASGRAGVTTGADLSVVQFDPNTGTLISDTFPVKYGAYVGAEKKKTLHLELAPPDLKEEEVTFSSKDVLLDSVAAPSLSAAAVADLKISSKQKNEFSRNGGLDLAVTLNRFGELIDLDAESKQELQPALDKVEAERKDYKEIDLKHKKDKKGRQGGRKRSLEKQEGPTQTRRRLVIVRPHVEPHGAYESHGTRCPDAGNVPPDFREKVRPIGRSPISRGRAGSRVVHGRALPQSLRRRAARAFRRR